jgi:hypothetical protein
LTTGNGKMFDDILEDLKITEEAKNLTVSYTKLNHTDKN